jgi:hypothetical protein
MKKIIFGPLFAAIRGTLRVIDAILNPHSQTGLATSAFPQPYSIHQPLFLG